MSVMDDLVEQQRRINEIPWYHEFNFPNGLKARSGTPDIRSHRKIWAFVAAQLDRMEFQGKTVLDLGCWDGYWSFYAERRGASRVLATDDRSQNWAGSAGVLLAKELFKSSIETNLNVSVYDAAKIGETFDIILCLGIYYHLVDPFYAFSQIRHCCHPETKVVFEGDATFSLRADLMRYDLLSDSNFTPTVQVLAQMLEANYFRVVSQTPMTSRKWRRRLRGIARIVRPSLPFHMTRLVTVCQPFEGINTLYKYRPPFGLHRFDERFSNGENKRSGLL
jgi:tRNA (mo5U34)-methyltransferase